MNRAALRKRLGPHVKRITIKASQLKELLDALDEAQNHLTLTVTAAVGVWNAARAGSIRLRERSAK